MRVQGKQGLGCPPRELRGQRRWIKLPFWRKRHLACGGGDANPIADYRGYKWEPPAAGSPHDLPFTPDKYVHNALVDRDDWMKKAL